MKAFRQLSLIVFGLRFSNPSLAETATLNFSPVKEPALIQQGADGVGWRSVSSPSSGTTWSTGVPKIEGGLGPAFSERFTMLYRRPVADGVSLFSSTALGLNPAGWLLQTGDGRRSAEPQSVFVTSYGLEMELGSHAKLKFSTGLRREVSPSHFDELPHFDAGVTLTLMPGAETWVAFGAFERWNLEGGPAMDVLTAMLGTRLWDLPVTFDVNSWFVVSDSANTSHNYESSAADTSLSWQITPTLWSSLGLTWNAEDSAGYAWATWSAYARLALRISKQVTYGIQLCQAHFSGHSGSDSAYTQDETRIRLSRNFRVSESFSTEISAEYAFGASSRPPTAPPALCLIGHILF